MAFYTRVIDDTLDLLANIVDVSQQAGWTVNYSDTYEVTISVRNSIFATYKYVSYTGGSIVQVRLSTGYTWNNGDQGGYKSHMPILAMSSFSSYIYVEDSPIIYHFSVTDDYFHIFKVKEHTAGEGLLVGEYIGMDGNRAGAYYSQGSTRPELGEKLGMFIPRDYQFGLPGWAAYDTGWSLFRKDSTTAKPGFKLKLNHSDYTTSNQGEMYLHKLAYDGTESDEDGSIYYGNQRLDLPKSQIVTNGTTTGWSDAYILFDTTLSGRFNMAAPGTYNYVVAKNVSGHPTR